MRDSWAIEHRDEIEQAILDAKADIKNGSASPKICALEPLYDEILRQIAETRRLEAPRDDLLRRIEQGKIRAAVFLAGWEPERFDA